MVKITCIKKAGGHHYDPHHAIESLGWINPEDSKTGRINREDMWKFLKNDGGKAYVQDNQGNVVYLSPREHTNGLKFVQTYADNKFTDNLLYLPEFR